MVSALLRESSGVWFGLGDAELSVTSVMALVEEREAAVRGRAEKLRAEAERVLAELAEAEALLERRVIAAAEFAEALAGRDAIARLGGLVINKQHKGNEPQFYESLHPGRCIHELWATGGRIAEKVHYADGTAELVPVPIKRLERGGRRTFRWYHVLTIPCRRGVHEHRVAVGTTSRKGERPPGESDGERGFHRAEHLQQIPEFTRTHQLVYPYRSDAESGHAQLDASLWNGRLILRSRSPAALAPRLRPRSAVPCTGEENPY
ncbi:hypothetical protein [Streptomyces sp. NBC_01216]|uniref:hypothetical protein n=1 Tax=unclassified Streptomyces TaxID=2593676 RepID=UPI002E0FE80A|nr:hypothetical protein OG393_18910 [Streptomyces sp. NBC_01216]